MIESFTFQGPQPGKHLLIFGAIHGDEVCGTEALQRLKGELESGAVKLLAGTLTMVPVCNPRAHAEKKRFIDANLNRVISDHVKIDPAIYETTLVPELRTLLNQCDVFLDLHSYDGGERPLTLMDYDTPVVRGMMDAIGVPDILSGWPELYEGQTDLSAGDTVQYAHEHGKDAILVECGHHHDAASIEVAYNAARRIMRHAGIADAAPTPPFKKSVCRMTKVIVREANGDFVKPWKHLDPVKKGDPIVKYADGRTVDAPGDGCIVFPKADALVGYEWVYFGVLE